MYLCENCYEEHLDHDGQATSIKNILAKEFYLWNKLFQHAQTETKSLIDRNLVKHKDLLLHLKRTCKQQPDIDAFNM